MNILQDLKQNEFHQQPRMSKSSSIINNNKKSTSSKSNNSYEIEIQIGIAYNQILQTIKQNGFNKNIKLPEDGIKSIQKLNLIKNVVTYLVEEVNRVDQQGGNRINQNFKNTDMDESNLISCVDCQNYENNLQKLQNQVRQHIRLQQQLKIYQQSMEQKIEELKKQKSHIQKKYDDIKKKLDEQKNNSTTNSDKFHKLEFQNQKLKAEIKQFKQFSLQTSKKVKTYDTRDKDRTGEREKEKENRIDWVHRMSSVNKKDQNLKDKTHTVNHTDRMVTNERTDRKSAQKRGDSSDRWRISGARSTKLMNFNDKAIQQKNKEERKKFIQSKFEYRR